MAYGLHEDKPVVFDGVRVTVRAVELPKRDGGVRRREVVEAADAVVILPLIADGRAEGFDFDGPGVVLIRNERFAVKDTLWELPAGTVEPGEDPDDCAGRELIEETGYRAQHIEKLTTYYPTPGFCTELLHAYRATGLSFVGQDLDETERIIPQVLPWDQAMQKVRDQTIRDAKTIAALLFHQSFKDG